MFKNILAYMLVCFILTLSASVWAANKNTPLPKKGFGRISSFTAQVELDSLLFGSSETEQGNVKSELDKAEFNFEPLVGYFITNNIELNAGPIFNYSSTGVKNSDDSSTSYGIKLGGCYYKFLKRNPFSLKGTNKLFAHVKGKLAYITGTDELATTMNGSTTTVETDFSGYEIEAFGGLTFAFGQLAGGFISLDLGYAVKKTTHEYAIADSDLTESGLEINSSVGIYF